MGITRLNWATFLPLRRLGLLTIPLCDLYLPILQNALPSVCSSPPRLGIKTTGTMTLTLARDGDRERVEKLLEFLKRYPLIARSRALDPTLGTELAEAYALDLNFGAIDPPVYTKVGELERRAKYDQDAGAARALGQLMADAILLHPALVDADIIAAIPGNPGKPFHLPDVLVAEIGRRLGRPVGLALSKVAPTAQLKGIAVEHKATTIARAFRLEAGVQGQTVLLVDDLFQSGTTMCTVAKLLTRAGARRVMGLSTVKTWRDTGNV